MTDTPPQAPVASPLPSPSTTPPPGTASAEALDVGGPLVTVRLLEFPVPLFARAQQASDELMREFTLIAEQLDQDLEIPSTSRPLPARLVRIVGTLDKGYAGFTTEQDEQLADAVSAGLAVLDELRYQVPVSVAAAVRLLGGMLDGADAYCRQGQHPLTLATPPELVAFRRWFLGEFERQASDVEPTPWPAHRLAQDVG